ncbi:XRE family transcriptional regulator [Pseudomonas cavernicola]|uniref:XRE family transcriptional regulator n=1 Tax=Pseudomonas cavernicola TaxID=2320866 RepID=A0A418XM57_9PSED|nr:helix-turn-helix transcriptional regulator [Pseudomonas cavernicola]RJG12919.1 XRE family transcriptional regulator [Pseudomonas cavernicola]RJG13534.1 XRE family transcriptional regulator [Pseudomonas cavernicola]
MELKQAFGEAIRRMRERKELPQEGVGASQSYISSIERGLKSPSLEKIEKIATVMGVHPMSILATGFLLKEPGLSLDDLLNKIRRETIANLTHNSSEE